MQKQFLLFVYFAPLTYLRIFCQMPMGRNCVEHYRELSRYCVFSHDEMICNMAFKADMMDFNMASIVQNDMTIMIQAEEELRHRIKKVVSSPCQIGF